MWVLNGARINFDRMTAFLAVTKSPKNMFFVVLILCNQLLLQFSIDVSQALQTYYG